MPHTLNPIFVYGIGETIGPAALFSGSVHSVLMSLWVHDPHYATPGGTGHNIILNFSDPNLLPTNYWSLGIDIDLIPSCEVAVIRQTTGGTQVAWDVASTLSGWPACATHVLISVDFIGFQVQCYLNDAPVPPFAINTAPASWFTSGIPFTAGQTTLGAQVSNSSALSYWSDFWFNQTPSFVDLTVTANRRKFINADLTPVDLGTNGQTPFGSAPIIYQTLPATGGPSDWLINRGSTGGSFTADSGTSFYAEGDPCVPSGPPPATLTDAELYFNPTSGFVDFSNAANRRLFVSASNGAQWLGTDGSVPFGSPPAVYLKAMPGYPTDFAKNNGVGGSFAVTGSITQALFPPGCTPYWVTTAAGAAANPEWRLTVSDDGGRTWSPLVKPRSAGVLGEYLTRLRWLKMGHSRQRMIRLESSDPVRRNIVGVYADLIEGMR